MKTLTVVLLALCAMTALAQEPPRGDTVIFHVNGEDIRLLEVNLAAQQIMGQMAQQGQQPDQDQVGKAAVAQVIDTKLAAQEARRRKIEVDQAKVDAAVDRFSQQSGGAEQLAAKLGESGLDLDWLRGVIGESLLVEELVEKRLAADITVGDEEVAKFYGDNPDAFKVPEQVKARHILFKADLTDSDEAREAARKKAEEAHRRAEAGEDFATLAKELSEGPSAPQGGDLGYFTKDRMVEPFATAAFNLKPGEISPVVGTKFGYHVIKVEDRKAPSVRALDEAAPEIKAFLTQQKTQQKISALLDTLRSDAKIEPVGPFAPTSQAEGVATEAGAGDAGATTDD